MKFRVLDGQRLVQVDHDVVSTDTTDLVAYFKLNKIKKKGCVSMFDLRQFVKRGLLDGKRCISGG